MKAAVCFLFFTGCTVLAMSGCTHAVNAGSVMESLVNKQWTNPQKPYGTEKVIVSAEGKLQEYGSVETQFPMRTFDFTITSQWINWRGDLYFTAISEIQNFTKEYSIERINRPGTVWETNFTTGSYPKKVDPSGVNYMVMYCPKKEK
jgi:hypothetical protein